MKGVREGKGERLLKDGEDKGYFGFALVKLNMWWRYLNGQIFTGSYLHATIPVRSNVTTVKISPHQVRPPPSFPPQKSRVKSQLHHKPHKEKGNSHLLFPLLNETLSPTQHKHTFALKVITKHIFPIYYLVVNDVNDRKFIHLCKIHQSRQQPGFSPLHSYHKNAPLWFIKTSDPSSSLPSRNPMEPKQIPTKPMF